MFKLAPFYTDVQHQPLVTGKHEQIPPVIINFLQVPELILIPFPAKLLPPALHCPPMHSDRHLGSSAAGSGQRSVLFYVCIYTHLGEKCLMVKNVV